MTLTDQHLIGASIRHILALYDLGEEQDGDYFTVVFNGRLVTLRYSKDKANPFGYWYFHRLEAQRKKRWWQF